MQPHERKKNRTQHSTNSVVCFHDDLVSTNGILILHKASRSHDARNTKTATGLYYCQLTWRDKLNTAAGGHKHTDAIWPWRMGNWIWARLNLMHNTLGGCGWLAGWLVGAFEWDANHAGLWETMMKDVISEDRMQPINEGNSRIEDEAFVWFAEYAHSGLSNWISFPLH